MSYMVVAVVVVGVVGVCRVIDVLVSGAVCLSLVLTLTLTMGSTLSLIGWSKSDGGGGILCL